MSDDKNPTYWARHARRYDRAIAVLNRNFAAVAQATANSIKGQEHVLEIAAGTGLVTVELAAAAKSLVATDASPQMLEILRGRLAASGQKNVAVQTADATKMSFADQSFDAVVIANLLHLLPQPELALREARRVLKPGGLLLAPTFCHGEHVLAHIVSRLLSLTGFPVQTRFNQEKLGNLVTTAGYKVESLEVFPGFLPVALVVAKI